MDSDGRRSGRVLGLVQLAGLVVGLGCASEGIRRFPVREPLWIDPDANPISEKPAKRFTSGYGLAVDATVLRPLARVLAVPLREEALNVNSVDEVPNSSWFTNRIGLRPMTPEAVARGACGDSPPLDPSRGPWVIASAKVDGSHPGFVIKAPDGNRYLLKFDGVRMSERATAADVIGSKIYHAAGFFTPCNDIVFFSEDVLRLTPTAKRKDAYGHDVPLTQADVDQILAAAWRRPDGRVRASASRYLLGEPLGPFRYEGTRSDDPNDVVPHEKRRELRGSMLLAAWIHHWDASENNTIDFLVKEGGRQFVRHHILDWGDALGDVWTWTWKRFNARVGTGRSGYLDLDFGLVDLVTLGLTPRPWYHVAPPPEPETFGYFDAAGFVPFAWRGSYGNPAFKEMTPRDALWAARIIARFTDEDIAAIVARARFEDPRDAVFLTDTLIKRRDVILRDVLSRGSPLGDFGLTRREAGGAQSLCFADLAIAAKVTDQSSTSYRIRLYGGANAAALLGWRQLHPGPADPAHTCIDLPLGPRPSGLANVSSPDDDPLRYAVLEISSTQKPSLQATATVLVHMVDLGPARGFRIIGLERPDVAAPPP